MKINTQIKNFLVNSLITNNPLITAKISGALIEINGVISIVSGFVGKGVDLSFLSSLISSGSLTSLDLSYEEKNTLGRTQQGVSTIFNPVEQPITSTATSPLSARTSDTIVTSPSVTQPTDIYVTPIGNEPPIAFRGQYPYVHTQKSESGHIREWDDTPGYERTFDYHKSGTYHEVDPSGRSVTKVVGEKFTVIVHDDHIHIEGSQDVFVKGNINITCLNNVTITSAGKLEINAGDDIRIKGKAIYLETANGDIGITSSGNTNITSLKDMNINNTGNTNIQTANNLNLKTTSNTNIQTSRDFNLIANNAYITPTENLNLKVGANTIIDSTADFSVKSSAAIILDATGTASMKSADKSSVDGTTVTFNQGDSKSGSSGTASISSGEAIIARKTGLNTPPTKEDGVHSTLDGIVQGSDDIPEGTAEVIQEAIDSGRITQEELDSVEKIAETPNTPDTTPSPPKTVIINPPLAPTTTAPVPTTTTRTVPSGTSSSRPIQWKCYTSGLENMPDSAISDNTRLSENYTVGDLSSRVFVPGNRHQLVPNMDKSKARIAANMSLLAQNVIEPIRRQFGPININSGFRPASGRSQHNIGQAVDITYGTRSTDPATMYDIACWIREHVPYDQLILEYGDGQIWTHISFNGESSTGCGSKGRRENTCPDAWGGAAATYPRGLTKYLSWRARARVKVTS